ncbi:MAG: hypothetical protein IJB17_02065 [Oscillospiraceae bacterium]|nr:hypothetical protein [Oscillospiraceae bacterium]
MKRNFILLMCLLAVLLLAGCSMTTVDQMYLLPKRSEQFHNLQSAIDSAMSGMSYSSPQSGENQQTVQQADLDGDGTPEYLLFAKSGGEKPLSVLIFRQEDEQFVLAETLSGTGSGFDRVEYVDIDGVPGVELVVGKQVSDQVLRSLSVYSFGSGQSEQLFAANYTHFLTCDLDGDGCNELAVLRPGQNETVNGVAVLYGVENGAVERSPEVSMSGPVENLKRIITGRLSGGVPAVFVGSTVEESAIITDVYAMVGGSFVNVSLSSEAGTSVSTLRNYYVYADDIDEDGEVELPDLITMKPVNQSQRADRQYLIRWFALKSDGSEEDKMYSFHNFVGGWYLQLDARWASRISVVHSGSEYAFYLWDDAGQSSEKVFSVFALTGQDREDKAVEDNRFVLLRNESTVYAAHLEVASGALEITQNDLINGFRLIRQDWNTGET